MKTPRSPLLRRLLSKYYVAALSAQCPDVPLRDMLTAHRGDAVSRRKFLVDLSKGALAVGTLTTMPWSPEARATEKVSTASPQPKIAIIGAGMAGLNCALTLQKQGLNATVYEASRRVGGRIFTHYNNALENGVVAELGGEFIDSNHADMLALAKEFNLELHDLIEDTRKHHLIANAYFFDGRHYSEKAVIKEFKKVVPIIKKDVASLGENYDTPSAEKLDNTSLAAYVNALPCSSWLKDLLKSAYVAEFGLEPEVQSSLNLLDLIGTDTHKGFEVFGDSDERFRIKQGNSALIKAMQERVTNSLVLGTKLLAIKDHPQQGYVLSFDGQADVVADYVVLTLPFTVLQDVKLDMREMTDDKRNVIRSLGYGQNNKLVLGYRSRPWHDGKQRYAGYLYSKKIPNGWDAGDLRITDAAKSAGGYVVLLGGDQAVALDALATQAANAPAHHTWKTALPEKEVNAFVDMLDTVFTGSRAEYNGRHIYASWTSNPYAKTSYTCYTIGQWSSVSGQEQSPIGNVLFAGEHCSEEFQGYMNGAAETGRVAAENIVQRVLKPT